MAELHQQVIHADVVEIGWKREFDRPCFYYFPLAIFFLFFWVGIHMYVYCRVWIGLWEYLFIFFFIFLFLLGYLNIYIKNLRRTVKVTITITIIKKNYCFIILIIEFLAQERRAAKVKLPK